MTTAAEQYMRSALELFIKDPPDNDFQQGYLEALKVFANEAMGFEWNDPLLWQDIRSAEEARARGPNFTVIEGGK